jgi:hypothetical protein
MDHLDILDAGRALDARGNIDSVSAGDADGLRDIAGMKAAGNHERQLEDKVFQQMPIEHGAKPARTRGSLGRAGIEQDAISNSGIVLQDGEIITDVWFPIPAKAGYAKMRHPASRFALTGVFVAKSKSGDVRVAATGASQNGVMRVSDIEKALKANWSAGAIDNVAISPNGMIADIHGTAEYRANLIKVMAQRAVEAAG